MTENKYGYQMNTWKTIKITDMYIYGYQMNTWKTVKITDMHICSRHVYMNVYFDMFNTIISRVIGKCQNKKYSCQIKLIR